MTNSKPEKNDSKDWKETLNNLTKSITNNKKKIVNNLKELTNIGANSNMTPEQQELQNAKNTAQVKTKELEGRLLKFVRQHKNIEEKVSQKLLDTEMPDYSYVTVTDIVANKNELLQVLDNEIVKTEAELKDNVALKKTIEEKEKALKLEINTAQTRKKTLEKDEAPANKQARETQKEVKIQEQEITKKESEISNKEKEITSTESDIKNLNVSYRDYDHIIEICGNLNYDSLETIEGKISEFLPKIKEDIVQEINKVNKDKNNSEEINTKLSQILDNIINEERIDSIKSQEQSKEEILDNIKSLLIKERDKSDEDKTKLKEVDLSQKKSELESLMSELEQAKSQLNELKSHDDSAQQKKLKVKNDLGNARHDIRSKKQDLKKVKEDLSSTTKEISNKESEIEKLKTQKIYFNNLVSDYEKAQKDEEEASNKLENAQAIKHNEGTFLEKEIVKKNELLKKHGYHVPEDVLKQYYKGGCFTANTEELIKNATCYRSLDKTLNPMQQQDLIDLLGNNNEGENNEQQKIIGNINMYNFKKTLTITLLLSSLSSFSFADDNMYLKLGISTFSGSSKSSIPFRNGAIEPSVLPSFGKNFAGEFSVGYYLDKNLRTELSISYNYPEMSYTYNRNERDYKYSSTAITPMLKAFYDIPIIDSTKLYIGVGIGTSRINTKVNSEGESYSYWYYPSYSPEAGISYQFSDNIIGELGYSFTYFGLAKEYADIEDKNTMKIMTHDIKAGLRFNFQYYLS